jgi:nitrogen fixation NifU-like protein
MDELRELYQEMILDHHKMPRNYHSLPEANHQAHGYNPLCGDKVAVYVVLEDDVIKDISFVGAGCAISTASSSIMTEAIKGKTIAEAKELFAKFHELVTSEPDGEIDADELGKLAIFGGVREFPVRVKCATLAWHVLQAALEDKDETVTTE